MTIKAIQTEYKGNFFRSRLEARWAVFFRTLGIEYVYEKEGYQLAPSLRYLPDFWLPKQECWIEIKGTEPTENEKRKIALLAEVTCKDGWILSGDIGEKRMSLTGYGNGYLEPLYKVWGAYGNIESYFSDYLLSYWKNEIIDFLKSKQDECLLDAIPNEIKSIADVQRVVVVDKQYYRQKYNKEHNGYTCNNLQKMNASGGGWSCSEGQIELARRDFRCASQERDFISQAYRAARSARFEHGENGATIQGSR